eukprot:CAMPEP_0116915994 /NCGR_PEP_ID=MMETSP0467-20121206/18258_1 /TAXON_ID=283647 /ORGANISM="Mesodinium pulex, Strain SPMC105" /LENGTH=43 /DNA_ID= /DNA_START= /DNA_END= /DNA_ORIENTATION=
MAKFVAAGRYYASQHHLDSEAYELLDKDHKELLKADHKKSQQA